MRTQDRHAARSRRQEAFLRLGENCPKEGSGWEAGIRTPISRVRGRQEGSDARGRSSVFSDLRGPPSGGQSFKWVFSGTKLQDSFKIN